MAGAAWLASAILSLPKKEWVSEQMKGIAFALYDKATRKKMFEQVYDIAKGGDGN